MTDAFGVNKSFADVVRGVRGGAKTASKVKLVPVHQPVGEFVHWDPVKAKALLDPATKKAVATQQHRYNTRMSFGKSARTDRIKSRGRTLTLKAKAAPIKTQISVMDRGAKMMHSSHKSAKAAGYVLRELGMRPDYAAMAATFGPKALARV